MESSRSDDEPTQVDSILIGAAIARARGDLRRATALLDAAAALDDRDPRVWDARGDLERDRQHYDLAMNCYKKALEIDPDRTETQEKLALASLGKLDQQTLTKVVEGGADATAVGLQRRSHVAMLASAVCPGLGHLWFEQYVRAAVFGGIHIGGLGFFALAWPLHAAAGGIGMLWTGYLLIGILVVNYCAALFDASRIATQRKDEHLY